MTSGFFCISRDLWDSDTFLSEPFSKREAWIWLIGQAAWKTERRSIGGRVIQLEIGQIVCSIRYLATAWRWDKAKVSRFISMLKNRDSIETAIEAGVTVITICNYARYQIGQAQSETPDCAEPRQQRDSSETNIETDKQINIETNTTSLRSVERASAPAHPPADQGLPNEPGLFLIDGGSTSLGHQPPEPAKSAEVEAPPKPPPKPKTKRATSIEGDWFPEVPGQEYAVDQGMPHGDIPDEAEKFVDYHRARGSLMKDWNAAWRTWCRNWASFKDERDRRYAR